MRPTGEYLLATVLKSTQENINFKAYGGVEQDSLAAALDRTVKQKMIYVLGCLAAYPGTRKQRWIRYNRLPVCKKEGFGKEEIRLLTKESGQLCNFRGAQL